MRYSSARAFGIAFCLTAAVLAPLIYGVYLLSQWQAKEIEEEQVAQSESGIVITTPTSQNCMTILLCVVGEESTGFGLLRLDAMENVIYYAALPSEGVLLNGNATPTLAESYTAAGPARVAQLLRETLGIEIDHYLAITDTRLPTLAAEYGSVRVGLSGALSSAVLSFLEIDGSVSEWTVSEMQAFSADLKEEITQDQTDVTPETLASVRNAFWEGWLRDKLTQLPATLPDALRNISASILSDISATDLYTLADTLEFLANNDAQVVPVPLVGDWNRSAGQYLFNDDTLAAFSVFMPVE
ncbi:MAG: hypothetical protein R3Y06_10255 [Faecalibacterium sp.]